MNRRRGLRSANAAEDLSPSDDVELLAAVVRRDPEAVRRLLDEVAPIVFGYLYARVGGDEPVAEDLLQETLFEAVRSASSFRGDSALSTWLCTIARRRLARHYESERRTEAARSGLRLALAPDPDLESDTFERQDEVVRALGRIPPTYRQVLVLKYLDARSVEEVASEMGRSRVQVQSLLQRARDRLRQELGEDRG
jgi:RNA polymerase sigma-70 factor (ECF subfamily)